MSFIQEISKYKQLNTEAETLKNNVEILANKLSIEINRGVDTPNTILEKALETPINKVSMVQKENGAYTLTITKE